MTDSSKSAAEILAPGWFTDKLPAGAGHDARAQSAQRLRFRTGLGNRRRESASRFLSRQACGSRAGADRLLVPESPRSPGRGLRLRAGVNLSRPSVPERLDTRSSLRLASGQIFVEGTILKRPLPCLAEPLDVGGILHPFQQFLVRLNGNNHGDGFPVAGDDLGFDRRCFHTRQYSLSRDVPPRSGMPWSVDSGQNHPGLPQGLSPDLAAEPPQQPPQRGRKKP